MTCSATSKEHGDDQDQEIVRLFEEAVSSVYPSPTLRAEVEGLGHRDNTVAERAEQRSRSPRRFVIAVAVVLMVSAGLGGLVTQAGRTSDSIATDTADRMPGSGIASTDSGRFLPSADRWVPISVRGRQRNETRALADVWAFANDADLAYILLSQPARDEGISLGDAAVETGSYRSSMWWTDGDTELGLVGLGASSQSLAETAGLLRRSPDGWSLPGADLIASGVGESLSPGGQTTIEYASVADDGTIGSDGEVLQIQRPGTVGDVFRTLFDASNFGHVELFDVAGQPVYMISGGNEPYAVSHFDGLFTVWQSQVAGSETEISDFVSVLGVVEEADWQASLDRWEQNVNLALSQQAARESIAAEARAADQATQTVILAADKWPYPSLLPDGFDYAFSMNGPAVRQIMFTSPDTNNSFSLNIANTSEEEALLRPGFENMEIVKLGDSIWYESNTGSYFRAADAVSVSTGELDREAARALVESIEIIDQQSLPRPPLQIDHDNEFVEVATTRRDGITERLYVITDGLYYADKIASGKGCCASLLDGQMIAFMSGLGPGPTPVGEIPEGDGLVAAIVDPSVAVVEFRLQNGSIVNAQPQDIPDAFAVDFIFVALPANGASLLGEVELVIAYDDAGNQIGELTRAELNL